MKEVERNASEGKLSQVSGEMRQLRPHQRYGRKILQHRQNQKFFITANRLYSKGSLLLRVV